MMWVVRLSSELEKMGNTNSHFRLDLGVAAVARWETACCVL